LLRRAVWLQQLVPRLVQRLYGFIVCVCVCVCYCGGSCGRVVGVWTDVSASRDNGFSVTYFAYGLRWDALNSVKSLQAVQFDERQTDRLLVVLVLCAEHPTCRSIQVLSSGGSAPVIDPASCRRTDKAYVLYRDALY
jgi:hypothetical protein